MSAPQRPSPKTKSLLGAIAAHTRFNPDHKDLPRLRRELDQSRIDDARARVDALVAAAAKRND